MLKKYLLTTAALAALSLSAVVQFDWNFNNPLPRKDHKVLLTRVKKRPSIYTKLLQEGVLANGDNALVFDGKSHQGVAMPDINFKEATVEIKFQINEAVKQRMTLFTYQKSKWHWAQLEIYLDNRNTIGARFSVKNEKKQREVKIIVPNSPLAAGVMHTLTLTTKSGEKMSLYLDGKLLKEEKDALSFSDLSPYVKFKHYPIGRLGYSVDSKIYRHFKGMIGGLKITDTVDKPVLTHIASGKGDAVFSRTDPNLVINKLKSAPVIDGNINDNAWKNCEKIGKFIVLGSMSKTVNALFLAADDKFVKNASDGILGYHNGKLYGAFIAPFPPGTKVITEHKKSGPFVWKDDCIGFFLRHGLTNRFYQIEFNSLGAWCAFKNSNSGTSTPWHPKTLRAAGKTIDNAFYIEFSLDLAEIGLKIPSEGSIWYGNITRRGDSCGGLSTWAPVGEDFQFAMERYGKFIIGSRRVMLKKELAKLAAMQRKYIPQDKKIITEINALDKIIDKRGENIANWHDINNQLQSLSNAIVQSVNKGKTWFIWQKPYCSQVSPDEKLSIDCKELQKISLKSAKGARPITSLLITNLSNRNFMGNIQLVAYSKKEEAWLKNIRFREIAFVELNGGKFIPDPVFDLPLGSVFRVPANNTGILQLDINTKNLKPGRYRAKIRFVPSYSKFEYKQVALELIVSPVDLDKVKMRTWTYGIDPFIVKLLKDYEFNTVCIKYPHFGPPGQIINKDGSVHFFKIEQLLKDLAANGIPKEDIIITLYPEYKWHRKRNFMSEKWQKETRKNYLDIFNFLKKHGLNESNLVFSPTDEPTGDPDDPKSSAWLAFTGAKFIRSINPKFRIFINPFRVGDGYHQRYLDTFDILCPSYGHLKKDMKKIYRDSGKDIWSYVVFSKSVAPKRYRHRFWENLEAGFEGPATFYSISVPSGDFFNSYDTKPGSKYKTTTDYSTTYINQFQDALVPSRRQEAWYIGWVEFKLAKFCREKIAALKKAGKNVSVWQKEYDHIVNLGYAREGDMEKAGKMLLELAEKLNVVK